MANNARSPIVHPQDFPGGAEARDLHLRNRLRPARIIPANHDYAVQGMNFAFTFPRVPEGSISAQELADRLLGYFDHIQSVVVATEHHADGGIHYHAYLAFERRKFVLANQIRALTGLNVFMSLGDISWLQYITKYDDNPALAGRMTRQDLAAILDQPDRPMTERIMQAMIGGTPPPQIMTQFRGYYLQHSNQVEKVWNDIQADKRRQAELQRRLPWNGFTPADWARLRALDLEQRESIASRIGHAIETFPINHEVAKFVDLCLTAWSEDRTGDIDKDMNLWIHGATNSGKSTLIKMLKNFCPIYEYHLSPGNFQRYDPNENYGFVVLDEFSDKDITVQQFNDLCDGMNYMDIKGRDAIKRHTRIPLMVITNASPMEFFHDTEGTTRKALFGRFLKVKCMDGQRFDLFPHLRPQNKLRLVNFGQFDSDGAVVHDSLSLPQSQLAEDPLLALSDAADQLEAEDGRRGTKRVLEPDQEPANPFEGFEDLAEPLNVDDLFD